MLQEHAEQSGYTHLDEAAIWTMLGSGDPIDDQNLEGILSFYGHEHMTEKEMDERDKRINRGEELRKRHKKINTRELTEVFNSLDDHNLSQVLSYFTRIGDFKGLGMFYRLLEPKKRAKLFESIFSANPIVSTRKKSKGALKKISKQDVDQIVRFAFSGNYQPALVFLSENPRQIRRFLHEQIDEDRAVGLLFEAVRKYNLH